MKILLLIAAFFLLLLSCGKKDDPRSLSDNNLVGLWRIDSICESTRNVCLYPEYDDWNTSQKSIILNIKADFSVESNGYHYAIQGSYFISEINKLVKISVKEIEDEANRPVSKWQPICIEHLNASNGYKVDGKQLKIYAYDNSKIIYLTQK